MIRKPVVAGMFYPQTKQELINEIELCFSSDLGPGIAELNRSEKLQEFEKSKVIALISPHAGYVFSGPCAAHGFYEVYHSSNKELTENQRCVVILGVNHTGLGSSGISLLDFETPLGVVKNNRWLSQELNKLSKVPLDEAPHIYEHSIEVQLPFLQYIFENRFTLIPIIVDADADFNAIGNALFQIKNKCKEFIVIASSDFTHYGFDYHYIPFGENATEKVKEDDLETIKVILKKDSMKFLERANERTICGRYTITSLLEYVNNVEKEGKVKGELLKYYLSNDIYPSQSFVGYASIVFKTNSN